MNYFRCLVYILAILTSGLFSLEAQAYAFKLEFFASTTFPQDEIHFHNMSPGDKLVEIRMNFPNGSPAVEITPAVTTLFPAGYITGITLFNYGLISPFETELDISGSTQEGYIYDYFITPSIDYSFNPTSYLAVTNPIPELDLLGNPNSSRIPLPFLALGFANPTNYDYLMISSTQIRGEAILSSVPEPAVIWLFGVGLIALVGWKRYWDQTTALANIALHN